MRGSDRQLLAAQHMEMQVLHGLAGILADIGDHAVAVVQANLFGQLGDHGKDMAQQGTVLLRQGSGTLDVLFGHNKKVHLGLRVDIVKRHDLIVLSDEIYAELTYNGHHVSIASLPGMKERTIVVNGFSKTFAMTGWRLGYATGPAAAIKQMTKIHQYAIMCAPTTSQCAAIEALDHCEENICQMREEYNSRRRYIVDAFNRIGLPTFEPEGAFYIFPCIQSTGLSSEEFCEQLLYSKRVAVVPGDAFGASGEGYVRVSYSYSVKHITEAVHRIEAFLQELKEKKE